MVLATLSTSRGRPTLLTVIRKAHQRTLDGTACSFSAAAFRKFSRRSRSVFPGRISAYECAHGTCSAKTFTKRFVSSKLYTGSSEAFEIDTEPPDLEHGQIESKKPGWHSVGRPKLLRAYYQLTAQFYWSEKATELNPARSRT